MSDLTRKQRKRDPRSVLLTTDGRGVAEKADALDALLGDKDRRWNERLARREQACYQLKRRIAKLERTVEMERAARVKWERKARGW